jgi:hypothetical protein
MPVSGAGLPEARLLRRSEERRFRVRAELVLEPAFGVCGKPECKALWYYTYRVEPGQLTLPQSSWTGPANAAYHEAPGSTRVPGGVPVPGVNVGYFPARRAGPQGSRDFLPGHPTNRLFHQTPVRRMFPSVSVVAALEVDPA